MSPEQTLSPPDFSLIRSLGPRDNVGRPHITHYQKGDKDLYYIGVQHGTDLQNRSHEIIGQAVHKHKPDFIIIEGVETEKGISPTLGFQHNNPNDLKRFLLHSEESTHIAEYARAKNIPFIGGEPTHQAIFKALEGEGYSTKDGMALFLTRMIPIWNREKVTSDKGHFAKQAENFLKTSDIFKHIPQENRLTFSEYQQWFDQHKSEVGNKDMLQLTAQDSNPINSHNANYFQKMSAVMDRVRDNNLVAVISDALATHKNVMVVYGNAHQYKSAPVFEAMFGSKPKIETLVLEEYQPPTQALPTPTIPVVTSPSETPHTTRASGLLKLGSVGLLAASGITALALGAITLPAIALLATSVLAFAGSKIVDKSQSKKALRSEYFSFT